MSIKSKNHLKRVLIQEWEAISPEIYRNLVNYMLIRCVSVIKAKGFIFEVSSVNMRFLSKLKSSVRTEK